MLAIIIYIRTTGNHSDIYTQSLSTHLGLHTLALSPCFLSPLADSLLLPFLIPFTYLETLLAAIGSVYPGPRLLVN
jgi:hypothetical protein